MGGEGTGESVSGEPIYSWYAGESVNQVGENDTGKSMLLEAIAVCTGYNPEGGNNNFRFASKETHSEFYHYLKQFRNFKSRRSDGFFLRAESFYNVASEVDRLYEGEPIPRYYGGRSNRNNINAEIAASVTGKHD